MPVIGVAAAAELDHAIDRDHDGRTAQSTELERATDGIVADDEGHLIPPAIIAAAVDRQSRLEYQFIVRIKTFLRYSIMITIN